VESRKSAAGCWLQVYNQDETLRVLVVDDETGWLAVARVRAASPSAGDEADTG
jgi:hypothetical protein